MRWKSYTKDFVEWQNNMYLPGAYTGGNLPPHFKYPNKKTALIPFVFGIGFFCMFLVSLIKIGLEKSPEEYNANLLNIIVFALLGFFFILVSLFVFIKYAKPRNRK